MRSLERGGVAVKETRREGLKRGKRGLRKEGGREKKGRAVAKRADRAFPRNGRMTAEAKRRVAGGKTGKVRFGTMAEDFGCLY